MFINVCDRCKTQKMCSKFAEKNLFLSAARLKNCVKMLLKRSFYAISYFSDTFKFHEMCNIIVLNLIKFKDSSDV